MTKQERMDQFKRLSGMGEEYINRLTEKLDGIGFFDAPASTKYHGACEGGLYDHCKAMYDALYEMTENEGLHWERKESPFLVSFLHDLCKCDQYKANGEGWEYRKDCLFGGHGEKSLIVCLKLGIRLTEEEMACIRYHMGAFTDKEEWSMYTGAVHKYRNVLWTHQADMIAAHVMNT